MTQGESRGASEGAGSSQPPSPRTGLALLANVPLAPPLVTLDITVCGAESNALLAHSSLAIRAGAAPPGLEFDPAYGGQERVDWGHRQAQQSRACGVHL